MLPATAAAKPHLGDTINLTGKPGRIARGPDGNIWVLTDDMNKPLVRISPSGRKKGFDPAALGSATGLTAGPDGALWATQTNEVVRIPVNNPENADDFTINAIGGAQDITSGPGGKLYTGSDDQFISFRPSDPTGFDAKTINGMSARGIASSGGLLWIADFGGQRIVSVKPNGTGVRKYATGGGPQTVSEGPGKTIAYGNPGDNPQTVGRITQGGNPKETVTDMADPFGMRFAKDKRWWFAEFAKARMGILSQSGNVSLFKGLPANSGPRRITLGPSHTIWVGLENTKQIAVIKGVG
jgi:virginiamycin B lyase